MNPTQPIKADDFDNGELFSADDDLTAYRKAERKTRELEFQFAIRWNSLTAGLSTGPFFGNSTNGNGGI